MEVNEYPDIIETEDVVRDFLDLTLRVRIGTLVIIGTGVGTGVFQTRWTRNRRIVTRIMEVEEMGARSDEEEGVGKEKKKEENKMEELKKKNGFSNQLDFERLFSLRRQIFLLPKIDFD